MCAHYAYAKSAGADSTLASAMSVLLVSSVAMLLSLTLALTLLTPTLTTWSACLRLTLRIGCSGSRRTGSAGGATGEGREGVRCDARCGGGTAVGTQGMRCSKGTLLER